MGSHVKNHSSTRLEDRMNQVHIITGGSSGIGFECAKTFTSGAVVITGRREGKLIEAVKELKALGIDAHYKQGDISSRESVSELFTFAKDLGDIKTVVNSAGVSGVGVDARLTFEIDLLGTENLALQAKEDLARGGVVILLASMMGHIVPPNPAYDLYLANPSQEGGIDALVVAAQNKSDYAYNFSKRGVQLMAKRFAWEYGEKGLRIVSLSPGIIMTPMSIKAAEEHPEQMNYMKSMTPAGRNGVPEDIAEMVAYLASDKASFITGTDILVDGGLTLKLAEIVSAYDQEKE